MSGVLWLEELGRDVRFALRTFRKNPTFTAVAVLCLALGIGANAAIFSVVDAVLLHPLPFGQPERLVQLFETLPEQGPDWRGSVSFPNYKDWAEQVQGLEGLAAYAQQGRNLTGAEGAERVWVVEGTANLFQILGVSTRWGRVLAPGDDAAGAAPVVVVSEGLWKRRFGAQPSLIGRTLTLDGQPRTVVGILPHALGFPVGSQAELFIPLDTADERARTRGMHFLGVVGRLRPGASLEATQTTLHQVARRLEESEPTSQAGRSATLRPLEESVVGNARPALLILQGAVLLVLLIACANVANLLLAQAGLRRHEVVIRLTLGASRARLVRQLLVESLVLALAGTLLGSLLALWAMTGLNAFAQSVLSLSEDITLQGRVFGFLLAVAVGSSVLFGLLPALQATRVDLYSGLVDSGARASPSRAHHRLRGGLVVGELALSLVLLVGAGLLLRGFAQLLGTEPGLKAEHVLTAHLSASANKYPQEQRASRLLEPVLEHVRAVPGVTSAALISLLPMQSSTANGNYSVEGLPAPEPGKAPLAEFRVSSPGLLATLGIPLLAGRDFTEQDGTQKQLGVLVNETLARRHFSGQDALGRRLLLGDTPVTILGITGDVRQVGLDQPPLAELYLPYNHPESANLMDEVVLVLKTRVAPASLTPALREAVRAVDAEQPIDRVLTMEQVIERSVAGRRMNLVLLGTFALIALVLATAGLYGVITHLVAQRTREMGIRMALGAQPADIVRLVMRQGLVLTALGLGLGLVGALGLSRFLESLLYGVSARDPLVFGALTVLLGGIALVATWLPARRATRVSPVIAMRGES